MVWRRCKPLLLTLPCTLQSYGTLINPYNNTPTATQTIVLGLVTITAITVALVDIIKIVNFAQWFIWFVCLSYYSSFSIMAITSIYSLESLGLDSPSLGHVSLSLFHISMDSPHKTFEASQHSGPMSLGPHHHNFTTTHRH